LPSIRRETSSRSNLRPACGAAGADLGFVAADQTEDGLVGGDEDRAEEADVAALRLQLVYRRGDPRWRRL
jgi:hypothetical protein